MITNSQIRSSSDSSDNSFVHALLDPFNAPLVSYPDSTPNPVVKKRFIHNSVYTLANSSDRLIVMPHSLRQPIAVYSKVGTNYLIETLLHPSDGPFLDNIDFDYLRLVAGGLSINSSTISTVSTPLSGTVCAAVSNDGQFPRTVSFQSLSTIRRTDKDYLAPLSMQDGVKMVMAPDLDSDPVWLDRMTSPDFEFIAPQLSSSASLTLTSGAAYSTLNTVAVPTGLPTCTYGTITIEGEFQINYPADAVSAVDLQVYTRFTGCSNIATPIAEYYDRANRFSSGLPGATGWAARVVIPFKQIITAADRGYKDLESIRFEVKNSGVTFTATSWTVDYRIRVDNLVKECPHTYAVVTGLPASSTINLSAAWIVEGKPSDDLGRNLKPTYDANNDIQSLMVAEALFASHPDYRLLRANSDYYDARNLADQSFYKASTLPLLAQVFSRVRKGASAALPHLYGGFQAAAPHLVNGARAFGAGLLDYTSGTNEYRSSTVNTVKGIRVRNEPVPVSPTIWDMLESTPGEDGYRASSYDEFDLSMTQLAEPQQPEVKLDSVPNIDPIKLTLVDYGSLIHEGTAGAFRTMSFHDTYRGRIFFPHKQPTAQSIAGYYTTCGFMLAHNDFKGQDLKRLLVVSFSPLLEEALPQVRKYRRIGKFQVDSYFGEDSSVDRVFASLQETDVYSMINYAKMHGRDIYVSLFGNLVFTQGSISKVANRTSIRSGASFEHALLTALSDCSTLKCVVGSESTLDTDDLKRKILNSLLFGTKLILQQKYSDLLTFPARILEQIAAAREILKVPQLSDPVVDSISLISFNVAKGKSPEVYTYNDVRELFVLGYVAISTEVARIREKVTLDDGSYVQVDNGRGGMVWNKKKKEQEEIDVENPPDGYLYVKDKTSGRFVLNKLPSKEKKAKFTTLAERVDWNEIFGSTARAKAVLIPEVRKKTFEDLISDNSHAKTIMERLNKYQASPSTFRLPGRGVVNRIKLDEIPQVPDDAGGIVYD